MQLRCLKSQEKRRRARPGGVSIVGLSSWAAGQLLRPVFWHHFRMRENGARNLGWCFRTGNTGGSPVPPGRFAPINSASWGGRGDMRHQFAEYLRRPMNRWQCESVQPRCHQRSHGKRVVPANFDVTTLISRRLQRGKKNMHKMLKMNELQNSMQVVDFSPVRKKNGVFRSMSHP
jgi:hypothetical protein